MVPIVKVGCWFDGVFDEVSGIIFVIILDLLIVLDFNLQYMNFTCFPLI